MHAGTMSQVLATVLSECVIDRARMKLERQRCIACSRHLSAVPDGGEVLNVTKTYFLI